MCFRKILNLITGRLPKPSVKTEEKPEKERPKRKWWQFPFRVISTDMGGLNMPKKQPCPIHGGQRKRENKSITGAWYYCGTCREKFLVLHP